MYKSRDKMFYVRTIVNNITQYNENFLRLILGALNTKNDNELKDMLFCFTVVIV